MLDSIILFDKTFEKRLEEFRDVLCIREPPVLATEIADEWSYRLELLIEPAGWQAIWKISRERCEDLHLSFPQYVFVNVEGVDFKELTASLTVISVQDDISLPHKLSDIQLIELYPVHKQDNPAIDVSTTANCIDQLRFFYNHLWQPWDLDDGDGEKEDWPDTHLEPRLTLFYDMKKGVIPAKMCTRFFKKLEEARTIHSKIQELQDLLGGDETAGDIDTQDVLSERTKQAHQLMQLHLKFPQLKTELQLVENPLMRKLMMIPYIEEEKKRHRSDVIAVWQGGNMNDYINYLTAAKDYVDTAVSIRAAPSLDVATEMAFPGNTVLLDPGNHLVTGNLVGGGHIRGVSSDPSDVVLSHKTSGTYLLSIRSNTLIQNVTLSVSDLAMVLLSRPTAELHLLNCLIVGKEKKATGVVALPGSSLIVESCCFSGFSTALFCKPGSEISLKHITITDCNVGVQAWEPLSLSMQNVCISACTDAAFVISDSSSSNEVGSSDLLNRVHGVNGGGISLNGNTRDVVLRKKSCSDDDIPEI